MSDRTMKKAILIQFFLLLLSPVAMAAENAAGLSLTETAGARPSALGEAMSAAQDDIAASHYNPATLRSLSSGQAMFSYQNGVIGDSFGRFMAGIPARLAAIGLSVGYY